MKYISIVMSFFLPPNRQGPQRETDQHFASTHRPLHCDLRHNADRGQRNRYSRAFSPVKPGAIAAASAHQGECTESHMQQFRNPQDQIPEFLAAETPYPHCGPWPSPGKRYPVEANKIPNNDHSQVSPLPATAPLCAHFPALQDQYGSALQGVRQEYSLYLPQEW